MEKYNGWTNYETWNVNLWIDNEEGSYNERRRAAFESYDVQAEGSDDLEESANDAEIEHAKWLEDWIDEMNPLQGQASMFTDILGAALNQVNWREIAEHHIAEAKEEWVAENPKHIEGENNE